MKSKEGTDKQKEIEQEILGDRDLMRQIRTSEANLKAGKRKELKW